MIEHPSRLVLRDLPLAARLTLALFLISVGVGYASALVNLHFQSASAGEALPTGEDVVTGYNGKKGTSQLERLLTAPAALPFNGQGSMRSAFTQQRVSGWKGALKKKAKGMGIDREKASREQIKAAEQAVSDDLNGERLALIAWLRAGAPEQAYTEDAFPLRGTLEVTARDKVNLEKLPVSEEMVEATEGGGRQAKIKTILETRCARCHDAGVGGAGARFPLTSFEEVTHYTNVEAPSGMSLSKLALSTHVHLLGFSMLYGMTGLIFALSSYPGFLRVLLAPLPLLAQVIDISFWWLARVDDPYGPQFALLIRFSGAVVATGLGLQIVLALFDLFGRVGKFLVFLLLLAGAAAGYAAKTQIIDPYLLQEKGIPAQAKEQTEAKEVRQGGS